MYLCWCDSWSGKKTHVANHAAFCALRASAMQVVLIDTDPIVVQHTHAHTH